jgi:hypothetical protein
MIIEKSLGELLLACAYFGVLQVGWSAFRIKMSPTRNRIVNETKRDVLVFIGIHVQDIHGWLLVTTTHHSVQDS